MKFSCLQENLVEGISLVGRVAQKTTSLPVLTNVHLQAAHGVLVFDTTNLEVGIQTTVRGKVEQDGECLIPARLLLDLLPLLPGGAMSAELTDEGLELKAEGMVTTLRTTPTADFPILPTVSDGVEVKMPRTEFVRILNKVMPAAGRVENRPQFNGVYVRVEGNEAILAATDGFRLAEGKITVGRVEKSTTGIVPLLAIQEAVRIFASLDDETVVMTIGQNQVKFEGAATVLVSRLVDGEYPDYNALFPAEPTTTAMVETAPMAKALKAATLFSKAGMSGVVIDISSDRGDIVVSSENGDVGAHRTSVGAKVVGDAVVFALNARYVLDAIGSVSGAAVLEMTSADRPLLVRGDTKDDAGYRHLIMPIRQ